MYIISKNKDYYDGVVGTVGMDKTIVYERHPNEIDNRNLMPKEFKGNDNHRSWMDNNPFLNIGYVDVDTKKTKKYISAESFIVGFCGKLYIGWRFYYNVKAPYFSGRMFDIEYDIIYDFEIAKKYLKEEHWNHKLINDIKYVLDYDPINIFRENNSPIFVYDSTDYTRNAIFVVNPLLKKYEFYKVVDAFTAFTELQMFISGVLGTGENDMIEIEDKYKIKKHGFNKWSFRKEAKGKG